VEDVEGETDMVRGVRGIPSHEAVGHIDFAALGSDPTPEDEAKEGRVRGRGGTLTEGQGGLRLSDESLGLPVQSTSYSNWLDLEFLDEQGSSSSGGVDCALATWGQNGEYEFENGTEFDIDIDIDDSLDLSSLM